MLSCIHTAATGGHGLSAGRPVRRIAGAGLDVLETEPAAADNPLLKMDNVLVTPHLATMTREAFERSRQFAILNAARAAQGEEPESVIAAG